MRWFSFSSPRSVPEDLDAPATPERPLTPKPFEMAEGEEVEKRLGARGVAVCVLHLIFGNALFTVPYAERYL